MRRASIVVTLALGCALAGPAAAQDAGAPAADAGATGTDAAAGPIYIDPADLADAPEVTAAASPTEVRLGDRFVLVITAAYDATVTVILPARLDLGGAFEERRRTTTDRTRSDGKKVREWQVEVAAWELGDLAVPPVAVTFIRGGQQAQVATNAVPVKVVGSLGDMVDSAQPRDLAAPVPLWRRTWLWVTIGVAALLVVIAVLVAVWIARRRRRRRRIEVVVPVTPMARISGVFRRPRLGASAEEALARLEEIDRSGMLARDRKAAYVLMIEIMQTFLGKHLGGDTDDMTTGELRAWLAGTSLPEGTRAEVIAWLDECDLVKFGGYGATVEEGRAQIGAARDVIISMAMPAGHTSAGASGSMPAAGEPPTSGPSGGEPAGSENHGAS